MVMQVKNKRARTRRTSLIMERTGAPDRVNIPCIKTRLRQITPIRMTTNKPSVISIVHFKRLGSRVSHDSFNQYVLFFSKQRAYCKTNAIYTRGNFIRFLERRFLNLFHECRNVNGTL